MADRPILFSGPMIRALLVGRKTQTRRIIKPQPIVRENGAWSWEGRNGGFVGAMGTHVDEGFPASAKAWNRIQPGDRLWVREAWRTVKSFDDMSPIGIGQECLDEGFGGPWAPVRYEADGALSDPVHWSGEDDVPGRLRASMHMPKWLSRITLIVTEVRVQRLQEISDADAIAEGVERLHDGWFPYGITTFMTTVVDGREVPAQCCRTAKQSFGLLWKHINGPGSWEANPWVVAYTFTVIAKNIGDVDDAASRVSAE